MKICIYLILITFFASQYCKAQNTDSLGVSTDNLSGRFLVKIQKKYTSIENSLSGKTAKYLRKMQRQEKKLQRKAAQTDSGYVAPTNIDSTYAAFGNKLSSTASRLSRMKGKINLNQYNPFIDTLSTSLAFLQQYKNMGEKIKLPTEALNNLKNKLNETEKVKEFIAQRKQLIKEQLSKFTHLPASLKNQYANIQKTAYYYSAQVKEYKEMLKEPEKIEKQALAILNKLPAFQKFMQKNSQLASLFNLPGSTATGNPAQVLAGLQTRSSVQGMIQQRIAAGGPNAMAQVQQNLQNAQSQLLELKDKLLKVPSPGGDLGEAAFKPNTQKTKPFFKRLEYGFNVQFSKNSTFVPGSANLALMVGYKLNDAFTTGIGMSYMMGLGSIQHISLTSQGLGFRSYLDWKISFLHSIGGAGGGLYVSGGYEMNYNSAFKNIAQLKNYEAWQRSALLGISKKYKISKKLKGNMQLLYDFLARDHVPVSQPVVFRMGYSF